ERALLGFPPPPRSTLPAAALEVRRADRAVFADVGEDALEDVAVRLDPVLSVLPPHPPRIEHAVAEEGVVLDREEARLVGPVLEELPLGEELVEPARLVGTEPAEEHEVRAPGDDVDRIDLEHGHA